MRQDLLLVLIEKRDLYDPNHLSCATREAFLSYVLDKAVLNLMEMRDRIKRGGRTTIVSLDEEREDENGDSCAFSDQVPEANLYGESHSPFQDADGNLETERLFRRLNKEQHEIGQLILQGYRPSEISRLIKMPRATLDREFNRMGKILWESGIQDFLQKESSDPSGKSEGQKL